MARDNKPLLGVKALVMGLGLHGGGVASVKWLIKQGASVSATDMRSAELLTPSLRSLQGLPVKYILGRHRVADFKTNDLVVVNPGVPRENEYLHVAKQSKKRIENDTSLFFRFDQHVQIAVTGTRGKTTTTQFVAELLKKKYPLTLPSGNTPENALLREYSRIKGKNAVVVAELSSWQLEYLPVSGRAPHIAVITNLFADHLNRYRDIADYADAKANIFIGQNEGDFLILNKQSKWTPYFLRKKPRASVFFVSRTELKGKENGIYCRKGRLVFRAEGIEQHLFAIAKFATVYGEHNLENLMAAVLAVKLFNPTCVISVRDVMKLSLPAMRQERVMKKGNIQVINDSCATSPDGTVAAISRFSKEGKVVLIAGGTDKALEYSELAAKIKSSLSEDDVVLLDGSGTRKLHEQLTSFNPLTFDTLEECIVAALRRANESKQKKVTVLFSPGAASFEKFLHEFDRGEKFNKLIRKYLK
jgi:UDP-N-acetylmuramoylalanine--D-glutamate ligase